MRAVSKARSPQPAGLILLGLWRPPLAAQLRSAAAWGGRRRQGLRPQVLWLRPALPLTRFCPGHPTPDFGGAIWLCSHVAAPPGMSPSSGDATVAGSRGWRPSCARASGDRSPRRGRGCARATLGCCVGGTLRSGSWRSGDGCHSRCRDRMRSSGGGFLRPDRRSAASGGSACCRSPWPRGRGRSRPLSTAEPPACPLSPSTVLHHHRGAPCGATPSRRLQLLTPSEAQPPRGRELIMPRPHAVAAHRRPLTWLSP